jgi:hypothetical protein
MPNKTLGQSALATRLAQDSHCSNVVNFPAIKSPEKQAIRVFISRLEVLKLSGAQS